MSIKKWIDKNCASLLGKTVAISGSTGGLGRELCRYFAALGASLILLDRNTEKSNALALELRESFPELSVSHIKVDMENMEAVKKAANALLDIGIDYLVLNAGAYSIPRKKCDTGYDNVFQINFVSPYFLARRLCHAIKERGGRIIAVGSIAHNYSVTDISDIDFSSRKKASLVYGNAKRYLMYSLSEEFGDTGAIAITHPGITFTGITSHYPKLIFAIIKHPMKLIFMPPKKAALSILLGLFLPTARNEWIGPRLFNVWGMPKKKCLTTAKEDEVRHIQKTARDIYTQLSE